MKLLLDQNLSYRLLEPLEPYYPGSKQVRLLGMEQVDDLTLWQYAKDNGFVIVTKDSDFHELSLIYGSPPKVIWLKCGNKPRRYILKMLIEQRTVIEQFCCDSQGVCLEIY